MRPFLRVGDYPKINGDRLHFLLDVKVLLAKAHLGQGAVSQRCELNSCLLQCSIDFHDVEECELKLQTEFGGIWGCLLKGPGVAVDEKLQQQRLQLGMVGRAIAVDCNLKHDGTESVRSISLSC